MKKSNLFTAMLLVIGLIGINCNSEPASWLPTSSSNELAGVIDDGTGTNGIVVKSGLENFDYSDTLYLSNYRVAGIPAQEEAQKVGTYYGTSISTQSGEIVMQYYYLPPLCGDFVLITEDGNAACYRTNEKCN